MKFLSTIVVASVVLSTNAAALPEAAAQPWCDAIGLPCPKKREADPNWCRANNRWQMIGQPCAKAKREAVSFCGTDGQPCAKVKRAADAFAEAMAVPNWCRGNNGWQWTGLPCAKSKRDAVSEAACFAPGAPCDVAKREAYALGAAIADALPAAEAEAFYADASVSLREAFPEVETHDVEAAVAKREPAANWCRGNGGWRWTGLPCAKAKRAAEAVAMALALPEANWCRGNGGWRWTGLPCAKAKRDADPEAEASCFAEDGPCAIAKRSADALLEAVEASYERL